MALNSPSVMILEIYVCFPKSIFLARSRIQQSHTSLQCSDHKARIFEMLTEAGQHWKYAMDHPEQTKPQMVGKKIPGAVGDSTLTRMYPKRHQDEYNRNRNKTRRTCDREFGDEDRTGKQCDEYPFASTWEGSATNGSDNFSVKMISSESNGAAGTWLGAWYAYDRILDGDTFNVQVEAPEKIATILLEGQPQDGRITDQVITSRLGIFLLTRPSYNGKSSMVLLMRNSMS